MAARPTALLIRAAGTNCENETAWGWELAGADPRIVHVTELIERPDLLTAASILTIPGGFSYGDDIAAGRIFGSQLERELSDQLRAFVERGGLLLGICNGLQVLVTAGLLPDPELSAACAVTVNACPGYQDRWITLVADAGTPCAFLEPGRTYELPIAHGEGRIRFRDAQACATAAERGCAAIRYAAAAEPALAATAQERRHGVTPAGPGVWCGNPNGSDDHLAGLCDPTGRVFGLMPHPDRFLDWTQHPAWTSLPERSEPDGLAMFRAAVRSLGGR